MGEGYVSFCFTSRRRHTRCGRDWSSDVCSSDLVPPQDLDQLFHPMVDPRASVTLVAKGLPASPGAATGEAVFDADEAEALAHEGRKVILIRPETSPEDFHGIVAAQAGVTPRGRLASDPGRGAPRNG